MSLDPLSSSDIMVEISPGSPVHDLFAVVRDKESDAMYQAIWGDFCMELTNRLTKLGTVTDPEVLKKELHAVRGMSAQFGLFMLEMLLFAWEMKSADPVEQAPRFLPRVQVITASSLAAVEQAFPHLKS